MRLLLFTILLSIFALNTGCAEKTEEFELEKGIYVISEIGLVGVPDSLEKGGRDNVPFGVREMSWGMSFYVHNPEMEKIGALDQKYMAELAIYKDSSGVVSMGKILEIAKPILSYYKAEKVDSLWKAEITNSIDIQAFLSDSSVILAFPLDSVPGITDMSVFGVANYFHDQPLLDVCQGGNFGDLKPDKTGDHKFLPFDITFVKTWVDTVN